MLANNNLGLQQLAKMLVEITIEIQARTSPLLPCLFLRPWEGQNFCCSAYGNNPILNSTFKVTLEWGQRTGATWHRLDFDLAPLHSACCNKINAQKPNYDGHFAQILAIIYVGNGSPPSGLAQLVEINYVKAFLLFILSEWLAILIWISYHISLNKVRGH